MTANRTWEELVAAGVRLAERQAKHDRQVSSLKWAWADLALEVAPSNPGNAASSHVSAKLEAWRQECGNCPYTLSSLRDSRYVAKCWPKSERERETSFEVHKLLRNRKDLMRPNLNRTQARRLLGYSNGINGNRVSFERLLRELRDPEVVDRLIAEETELVRHIADQLPRRGFMARIAA